MDSWSHAVHESHIRLGIRASGNCAECRLTVAVGEAPQPVRRPEWVRRMQVGDLRAKELVR